MSNNPTIVGDHAWLHANREDIKAGAEEEIMEAMPLPTINPRGGCQN